MKTVIWNRVVLHTRAAKFFKGDFRHLKKTVYTETSALWRHYYVSMTSLVFMISTTCSPMDFCRATGVLIMGALPPCWWFPVVTADLDRLKFRWAMGVRGGWDVLGEVVIICTAVGMTILVFACCTAVCSVFIVAAWTICFCWVDNFCGVLILIN